MTDVSNERLRYEDYGGHTRESASLRMADHDKDYRDDYFDEATGRGVINGQDQPNRTALRLDRLAAQRTNEPNRNRMVRSDRTAARINGLNRPN